MVCCEEEIFNVGDYIVYDNVGKFVIVVCFVFDKILVFYNVCLYCGCKFVIDCGCKN